MARKFFDLPAIGRGGGLFAWLAIILIVDAIGGGASMLAQHGASAARVKV